LVEASTGAVASDILVEASGWGVGANTVASDERFEVLGLEDLEVCKLFEYLNDSDVEGGREFRISRRAEVSGDVEEGFICTSES
jgi:hypothetical protein